jgi:hypothetical protein
MLGMSVYGAYLYGPLPGSKEANISMITQTQKDRDYIKQSLQMIDSLYKVAATNNLGTHCHTGSNIYVTSWRGKSRHYRKTVPIPVIDF